MIALALAACGGSAPALPQVPSAEPATSTWVVGVTREALWLEGPGHPRAPLPDAGGADPAIPALLEALAPVLAAEPDLTPAVAADADVPWGRVARVLVSFGLAPTHDARIRVSTPAGPGELPFAFPRFCGGPTSKERLAALSSGPSACVAPIVRDAAGGLRVDLVSVPQDQPGCLVLTVPPTSDGWDGAVALPAPGACPSVAGRDPVALGALLAETGAYGPPCGTAQLSLAEDAPWGEAVGLWQALRARHAAAALGLGGPVDAGCATGVAVP